MNISLFREQNHYPFFLLKLSWPLILDPDSKSIRWINNMHRNRIVRHIQQGENEEEIASILQKCIRNGEVAIFYDVISFDSCFDSVLTNKVVTTKRKLQIA